MSNPTVTIKMEDNRIVNIELLPEFAPNTVNNFIFLAQKHYYDGLIFHRVIPDFMIQGGCPDGTGTGGPGYSIKGEFKSNGYDNKLEHRAGVISMARSSAPDSAGSQFFITVADCPHLDGQYAAFGRLTSGFVVCCDISLAPTDGNDKPKQPQRIKEITVELNGFEPQEPEKM